MKQLLRFLLSSKWYISICAVVFCWAGLVRYAYEGPFYVLLCVFLATFLIYRLGQSYFPQHWDFIAGLILLIVVCMLPVKVLIFLIHLLVLAVGYSPPNFLRIPALRRLPFLKIFLVAYVWASVTVALPAILAGVSLFEVPTLALFFEHFLFIFLITLPFDIRDIQEDKREGILTLPIALGLRKSKMLVFLFCGVGLLMIVLINPYFNLWTWPVWLAAFLCLYWTERQKSIWYFNGFIDGLIIVYALDEFFFYKWCNCILFFL